MKQQPTPLGLQTVPDSPAELEQRIADLEFNQRKILEALHIAPKSPTTP
jgi:hypothetical protein